MRFATPTPFREKTNLHLDTIHTRWYNDRMKLLTILRDIIHYPSLYRTGCTDAFRAGELIACNADGESEGPA